MRLLNKAKARAIAAEGRKQEQRDGLGLGNVDNTADIEKPLSIAAVAVIQSVSDSVQIIVPVYADGGANMVLTNQASAEDFLGASSRNEWLIDLTHLTEVRMTARVMVASASANTPKILLRHYGFFSVSAYDFTSDVSDTEVTCSLAATGLISSGWLSLRSSARADIYLAVIQKGGDGAADPELGSVVLHFR